ncbi:hypothetical protein PAECIP111891_00974 [Paenibacillus allorhizoplanae]|uniref:Uncharacterized protein n=1 Tax=Paenibacillus allorhizoplanae TaxID=2905648 RepID=A0ABM9BXK4_9BACL|nr:hypothetical protein PAECIP111891_00974 [Paenibacillus allorhizoplanae]
MGISELAKSACLDFDSVDEHGERSQLLNY